MKRIHIKYYSIKIYNDRTGPTTTTKEYYKYNPKSVKKYIRRKKSSKFCVFLAEQRARIVRPRASVTLARTHSHARAHQYTYVIRLRVVFKRRVVTRSPRTKGANPLKRQIRDDAVCFFFVCQCFFYYSGYY